MTFMDKRHSVTTILTAPVSKFRFVALGGRHATSSDEVDGVSEEAGGIGDAVTLVTGFSSLVEAAGPITAGALVGPAGDGTGRAAAGGGCGRARTSVTAAGQMVVVELFRGPAAGLVSGAGFLSPYPRRSSILTRGMATFVNAGTANASPGWTSHIRVAADGEFTHARLIIPNLEAAAITGCTAIVAATANSTSKITPTGTWATVTVAGSSTFTLPARVSASEPSYTVTDWIRLDSIARDDGGTLPLAMARLFIPVANGTFSTTGGLNGGFDALYPDALAWQTRQQVDGVGTPANLTSTGEGTTVAFHAMQFRGALANATILGVGDSITSGFGGTVQQDNWGWRAVNAMRALGYRASWMNGGVNGQTSAQYLARGKSLAAACAPQIVTYSPFTPNDGTPNATTIAAQWANTLDFLEWAASNRYVPVLTTPCPWDSLTLAQDDLRKGLRDRVLALRDRVDVIDFDAVLSTQASPARFGAGLGDGDKHPVTAGYAAMATAAQAVFASILARPPA